MKLLRLCCMMALVVALLMGLSCPATAKLPVGVNLFGSATDGAIDGGEGEEYIQVFPDGTTFTPYSLPTKKMLIIQTIWVSFSPTNPTFTPPVKFVIANSAGTTPNIFGQNLVANSGNTLASIETTFTPGLPINVKPVMKVIDSNGAVIPGTLKVRILGIVQ
jgi:hypothetical protein